MFCGNWETTSSRNGIYFDGETRATVSLIQGSPRQRIIIVTTPLLPSMRLGVPLVTLQLIVVYLPVLTITVHRSSTLVLILPVNYHACTSTISIQSFCRGGHWGNTPSASGLHCVSDTYREVSHTYGSMD